MLQYLMETVNALFALAIATGFVFAFIKCYASPLNKRIFYIATGSGLLLSLIRSIIFNNFRIRNSWKYGMTANLIVVISFILAVILVVLLFIKPLKEKLDQKNKKITFVMEIVATCLIATVLDGLMFNNLNDVWYMPVKFNNSDVGIISSEYLLKLLGYLIGVIFAISLIVASCKTGQVAFKKNFKFALLTSAGITFFAVSFETFWKLISSAITRKFIRSYSLFQISSWSKNHSEIYTYVCLSVLILLCVFLWINSYIVKEKYANNAEHRKQKVVWRTAKRVSLLGVVGLTLFTLCQTVFVDLTTVVIKEAELETPIVLKNGQGEDETLVVPLTMVNDAHLHKFEYITKDQYHTRFIVILKQAGTSNYGVGLDACEICGEAGYYENSDGQVVCKKCGVIMNTITIGMKGGCNPIIIEYDIDESNITIPVSEMVNNQTKFSK